MEASRVDTRVHKSVNTDETNEHDQLYIAFYLHLSVIVSLNTLHFPLLIKIIALTLYSFVFQLSLSK